MGFDSVSVFGAPRLLGGSRFHFGAVGYGGLPRNAILLDCFWTPLVGVVLGKEGLGMRPVSRRPVRKHDSAQRFRAQVGRTKRPNLVTPMRGGWRL